MTAVHNPEWRLRRAHTPPVVWDNTRPGWLALAQTSGLPFIPQLPQLGLNKLGAHKPKLKLANYYDPATAQPPSAVSRPHAGFSWAMLANDRLGDCVCAAILHAINSWLLDIGAAPIAFLDADAIALYMKIGGYNPKDPNTDQGCDEDTAMNDWEAGLPRTSDGAVHTLAGTVSVDSSNLVEQRIAINEFDGVFDGIDLPVSAQGQSEWDVVGDPGKDPDSQPGSWGGHATYTREYDPQTFRLITWGAELLETVAFRSTYHSQAFAVLPADAKKSGVGPSGVQWDDLLSDINKLVPAKPKSEAAPRPRSKGKTEPKGANDESSGQGSGEKEDN